jgi:hypothetical protein
MELKQGNTIPDATGNGHALTIQGAPTFQGRIVIFNDDGVLWTPDSSSLDLVGSWTVSYWVRQDSNDHSPNSNTTNAWVFKQRAYHDSEGGWAFWSDAEHGIGAAFYSPNWWYVANSFPTYGAWYLVSHVYDAATGEHRVYVDISMKALVTGAPSLVANTYPVVLGGNQEEDQSLRPYCKGAMGDVRIYNRALSAAEIEDLFLEGTCDFPNDNQNDMDGDGTLDGCDGCPSDPNKTAPGICGCGASDAIDFVGFLPPIGGADATGGSFADPLRAFKLGSTIPVKIAVSQCGNPLVTGIHTLQAGKYSSATDNDAPIDATPTDAATTGNQFRLTDGEWHFNLSTTGLSTGTWKLIATLSDGSTHGAWITIKK